MKRSYGFLAISVCALCSVSRAQFPAPTYEFAPSTRGTVTVPVRNGLDFPVQFNGGPTLDVAFDTGAYTLLSTNLAQRLGLKLQRNARLGGFGSETRDAATATVDTLSIGGLTLHGVVFIVADPPVAGSDEFAVIGGPLVRELVIGVNYFRHEITFTDPAVFHYTCGGTSVPLRVDGFGLAVDGLLDGIPGKLSMDTGDTWSMEVMPAFVQAHNLVRRYRAKYQGFAGSGFGGPDTAFYARMHTVRIGAAEVHDPIALLLTDSAGLAVTTTHAANIGTHILRQFNLTFDVPHGVLYLERSGEYGKPDIFNRAGLVLDGDRDALLVRTVLPGSPGDRAGIVEGDRITEVNGKATTQPTDVAALSETVGLESFQQPVGTVLRIVVKHGDGRRTVSLTLREIL